MNMWKCFLLLVLWPVHLNCLSVSLPPFPCWNIWFTPSQHKKQPMSKFNCWRWPPFFSFFLTHNFSLLLSFSLHPPPPSFQTRDDFLGQVDVPLSHLPVSYLCLSDQSWLFWTLSYFLSLSGCFFLLPRLISHLEGQAKVFWLECEKLQASQVECCDQTADPWDKENKWIANINWG